MTHITFILRKIWFQFDIRYIYKDPWLWFIESHRAEKGYIQPLFLHKRTKDVCVYGAQLSKREETTSIIFFRKKSRLQGQTIRKGKRQKFCYHHAIFVCTQVYFNINLLRLRIEEVCLFDVIIQNIQPELKLNSAKKMGHILF